jgi:hypothetical protein
MGNFSHEEINLIHKLWIHTCFGKGHMLIDNLIKGFPSHLKGQLKDDVDNLIRRNILVKKPTRHGYAVYINVEHRYMLERELKKHFTIL